jgi:sigma-E factor negative regulatory protein RseA
MNDKISALMDGEADDRSAAQLIETLARDAEALRTWRTYHLIGDAMRDAPPLSQGFTALVVERLAVEPTVLAPRRLPAARPRTWFALSAAASFAAVALVGWMAFAPQPTSSSAPASVAQAPAAPALVTQPPARIPPPSATNDYLLAHQGYSPRAWLHGMAPYARTVSGGAQEGRR